MSKSPHPIPMGMEYTEPRTAPTPSKPRHKYNPIPLLIAILAAALFLILANS